MPYIRTENPYMALGAAGRGVGSALTQAMFQVPAIRAEQAYRQQQLAMQQQQLGMQQQELDARVPYWKAQADQAQAAAGYDVARTGQIDRSNQIYEQLGKLHAAGDEQGFQALASTLPADEQRELFQTRMALQAGAFNDPNIALSLAGGRVSDRYHNVPDGATAYEVGQGGGLEVAAEPRYSPERPQSSINSLIASRMNAQAALARMQADPASMLAPESEQALTNYLGLVDQYLQSQGFSPAQQPAPVQLGQPTVGQVIDGYEFLGGDPADQNNWRKVQ